MTEKIIDLGDDLSFNYDSQSENLRISIFKAKTCKWYYDFTIHLPESIVRKFYFKNNESDVNGLKLQYAIASTFRVDNNFLKQVGCTEIPHNKEDFMTTILKCVK